MLCLLVCRNSNAQTSNTIPQLYTLKNEVSILKLNIPKNHVEVFKTKGTRISIETSIHLGMGTLPLLDYLTKNGRYELIASTDSQNSTLVLSPKKNQKILLIKGEECPEKVRYKIHIPDSIHRVELLEASDKNFIAQH